jgi:hypothetical protein
VIPCLARRCKVLLFFTIDVRLGILLDWRQESHICFDVCHGAALSTTIQCTLFCSTCWSDGLMIVAMPPPYLLL